MEFEKLTESDNKDEKMYVDQSKPTWVRVDMPPGGLWNKDVPRKLVKTAV